jgi:hypothetical protein
MHYIVSNYPVHVCDLRKVLVVDSLHLKCQSNNMSMFWQEFFAKTSPCQFVTASIRDLVVTSLAQDSVVQFEKVDLDGTDFRVTVKDSPAKVRSQR